MQQPGQTSDLQMQQIQAMLSMAGNSMGGMAPPSQPAMPGVDPNMAQAYLTMLQYLTQQSMAGAGGLGMPPMPFPGMTPPYTQPPSAEHTVSVSVEGMKFQYQLTEDDLHKVFGRYGGVKQIRVDDAGAKAQVTFLNFDDANSAMNDLNGKVLNGLEGTLRISWVNQGQPAMPTFPPPIPGMPFPFPGMPGLPGAFPGAPAASFPAAGGGAPFGAQAPAADGGGGKSGDGKGVRKYTCRFIIGIENDKEFQVSRRVIGAKGANMKRVVKNTDAKLRLRGMGSGYLEGAGKKESTEPLQLCISCTNAEHYKEAVRQVEDILKRVYEEYSQFCKENGRPEPDLQINCSENQLVYSATRSAVGGSGKGMEDSPGDKRDKKERRSRGKGSKVNSASDDCGEPGPNAPPVEEIEKVIDMRNEARRACNYAEADRLRDALHAKGVALMDEPGGRGRGAEVTTWRYWRD